MGHAPGLFKGAWRSVNRYSVSITTDRKRFDRPPKVFSLQVFVVLAHHKVPSHRAESIAVRRAIEKVIQCIYRLRARRNP